MSPTASGSRRGGANDEDEGAGVELVSSGAGRPARLRRMRMVAASKRTAVPLLDQGVSSLSNFVIAVVAARGLTRAGFGAFNIAYTCYVLVVSGCRLSIGALILRHASSRDSPWASTTGAAVLVALLGAGVLGVSGGLVGGATGSALLAMAVVLPFVIGQDAFRHCFVGSGKPGAALLNDAVWLIAIVPAVKVVEAIHHPTQAAIILAWGAAGAVTFALALWQSRTLPHLIAGARWLREKRHLALPYLGEYLALQSGQQIALLTLAPIAGIAAVGAVRGATVFFGPLNVLATGLYLVLIPEARRLESRPRRMERRLRNVAILAIVGVAAWTVLGRLLPTSIGNVFLGSTWQAAQGLITATGLGTAAICASVAPYSGLRALNASRYSIRAMVWSFPMVLILAISGAVIWGVVGFVWGSSIESVITLLLLSRSFHRANAARGSDRERLHIGGQARHARGSARPSPT